MKEEPAGEDKRWMRRALALARKAKGRTSPNPTVGAVLVKRGRRIGAGFHPGAGHPHAEILALEQAGDKARNSTLYVTLEPCCYQGRTPPCVEAILRSGIKRVVAAMEDPHPRVRGRSLSTLRKRGVAVVSGLLEEEARRINEDFVTFHVSGRPFVTVKVAMTLDGKIATARGESKWVTGDRARLYAHRLRHEHDAVLVGIRTILADDPQLTTRFPRGKDAHRIIADSRARLPLDSKVLQVQSPAITYVAVSTGASAQRIKRLEQAGARILRTEDGGKQVHLPQLMSRLAQEGMLSVLIEGGGRLLWSALESGIVDKVALFIAPKIIGGSRAITAVEGAGRRLEEAWRVHDITFRRLGEDFLLVGYMARQEATKRNSPQRRREH